MPTAIAARNFSNVAPVTNLTASVDNAPTTTNLQVGSTVGYPAVPFTGCLERNTTNQEFVLVTAVVGGNNFTVVRGYDNTPIINHNAASNPTFEHCTGAIDFREANQHHTDTTRDDHLQYLPVSGARAMNGPLASLGTSGAPGDTRYMGMTTTGPPTGTSVSYALGDWVFDQTGARWFCVLAGAPGTWVPEPGRVVARLLGPPSPGRDVINTTFTVISSAFTFVKGIQYVVDARIQSPIVTGVPSYINSILSVGSLTTGTIYVMSMSSTAMAVGGWYGGAVTTALNIPASTASVTITLTVTSGGAGVAYRMETNNAEVIVRRA